MAAVLRDDDGDGDEDYADVETMMIVRMTVMVLMMLMFCSRQGYAQGSPLKALTAEQGAGSLT